MKHFNENNFLSDIGEGNWNNISSIPDLNTKWEYWKTTFLHIMLISLKKTATYTATGKKRNQQYTQNNLKVNTIVRTYLKITKILENMEFS